MLWKKESNSNDPMYVDLFALNGGTAQFEKLFHHIQKKQPSSTLNKNDAVSLQKRNEGNEYFKHDNWILAMEKYGESLCYAENGSKNVSLAYGNRSACFLKMKLYNECLVDIKLAKEAGYPSNLMQKLQEREEKCLKAIQESVPRLKIGRELSIAPDEKFPCMANVLKIDHDADGNLALFANEKIEDVGQTIVVAKAFTIYLYSQYGLKCNICLKECTNLVPCQKCTVAMFCSEECLSNSLHEYECGIRYCDKNLMNGTIMRIVRVCLMAIDMFSDANELMSFVEQTIASDRIQIPSNLSDPKSRYATFLKLPMKPECQDPSEFAINLSTAFITQKILMSIPKILAMFNSEKYHRFLIHFTTHLYQVMENNSCIRDAGGDDIYNCNEDFVVFDSQTGLMNGFLKHSCAPNVLVSNFDDKMVITNIRPVQKGEQLMLSFLLPLLALPKHKRSQMLWLDRRMICKCARCEDNTPSKALCKRIKLDPDYQFIVKNQSTTVRGNDEATQTMIDKCKSFLQKYGQSPWTTEFGKVVMVYESLIRPE